MIVLLVPSVIDAIDVWLSGYLSVPRSQRKVGGIEERLLLHLRQNPYEEAEVIRITISRNGIPNECRGRHDVVLIQVIVNR
jgi:hypothetical protein